MDDGRLQGNRSGYRVRQAGRRLQGTRRGGLQGDGCRVRVTRHAACGLQGTQGDGYRVRVTGHAGRLLRGTRRGYRVRVTGYAACGLQGTQGRTATTATTAT